MMELFVSRSGILGLLRFVFRSMDGKLVPENGSQAYKDRFSGKVSFMDAPRDWCCFSGFETRGRRHISGLKCIDRPSPRPARAQNPTERKIGVLLVHCTIRRVCYPNNEEQAVGVISTAPAYLLYMQQFG
ncbi:MAG: hypothetical protein ACKOA7_00995, partial [Bacteroidota bacterium]